MINRKMNYCICLITIFFTFYGCVMAQEKQLEKDKQCYVIRFAEPFVKKEFGENYKKKFQLLDVCLKREKGLQYPGAYITIERNGETIQTQFDVLKSFENETEARDFADKNHIADTPFLPKNDCDIIRIIDFPLTKRPNTAKIPTIALLNTCLFDETEMQRPSIDVMRIGKSQTRLFEPINTFADKREAEKYAKNNNLFDVNYNDDSESGKIDAELTKDFLQTMRGDISDEVIKLKRNFRDKLLRYLKNSITFQNPLINLSHEILVKTSPDGKLKFYSWDTREGGTTHVFELLAQYQKTDGTIEVNDTINPYHGDLPNSIAYFNIFEINEFTVKNQKYYLTFGWGTSGSGHQSNIIRIFRIGANGLVQINDLLPKKRYSIITFPRNENLEIAFNQEKSEISYREFKYDEDSGFMKPTGKRTMIILNDKKTINSTSYIVFDGSRNKYIITENSLEYIPVKPAESSSGVYSGGEYVKKSLTAEEYKSIVELMAKAMADKEIQTDTLSKGNPIITVGEKKYILKMNAEIADRLVKMLKNLRIK